MDTETQAPPQVPPAGSQGSPFDDDRIYRLLDALQRHAEREAEVSEFERRRQQWGGSAAPTPNLNKALSAFQAELPKVTKDQEGKVTWEKKDGSGEGSYPYRYADLAAVTEAIGPLLGKHGLSWHCQLLPAPPDRRHLWLIGTLAHESGEERVSEWYVGESVLAAQKLGARITYGRRYMLGCATGVAAEHDDDGQYDSRTHQQRGRNGSDFDGASRQRPDRGGSKQQASDGVDKVAQALATAALRVGANQEKTPADLQGIERTAAAQNKLDAPVANPFGDGLVKLRDVLREVRRRMSGGQAEPGPDGGSGDADEHDHDPGASASAGASDAERDWLTNFAGRAAAAPEDQLGGLQREIGQAVKNRLIGTEAASAAADEVSRRRRELRDGPATGGAGADDESVGGQAEAAAVADNG